MTRNPMRSARVTTGRAFAVCPLKLLPKSAFPQFLVLLESHLCEKRSSFPHFAQNLVFLGAICSSLDPCGYKYADYV